MLCHSIVSWILALRVRGKNIVRYKDTGELHMDFHGATNTTIKYIVDHFGEEALTEIFTCVGKDVYKSIHNGLMNDDPSELIEHLNYYLSREKADYTLEENRDGFILLVNECPAVRHIKKIGLELSPYFHRQDIDISNAMCDGTPWQCETEIIEPGKYRQTFSRRQQS
jgi:hypothetical protein